MLGMNKGSCKDIKTEACPRAKDSNMMARSPLKVAKKNKKIDLILSTYTDFPSNNAQYSRKLTIKYNKPDI